MSKIIMSVDMELASSGEPCKVRLVKVTNSVDQDITDKFRAYCINKGIDISDKTQLESAGVPFTKEHEGCSFLP